MASPLVVSVDGTVAVAEAAASASARSVIAGTGADQQLLAALAGRKGVKIYNPSATETGYLGTGATAVTAANASLKVPPGNTAVLDDEERELEVRGLIAGGSNWVVTVNS